MLAGEMKQGKLAMLAEEIKQGKLEEWITVSNVGRRDKTGEIGGIDDIAQCWQKRLNRENWRNR